MRVRMFSCSAGTDQREHEGDFELNEVLINNLDGIDPLELGQFVIDLENAGIARLYGGTGYYAEFEPITF